MVAKNHLLARSSFHRHLDLLNAENLKQQRVNFKYDKFDYPGLRHDILFESECKHQGGLNATCSNCGQTKVIQRTRKQNEPVFHRGTIASGDGVIQDGEERDRLSQKHGAIVLKRKRLD
jgi:hypothetical protein